MISDPKSMRAMGLGALVLLAAFGIFRFYTLSANLKASAGINQRLKADLERLEKDRQAMQDESHEAISRLSAELQSLRAKDTESDKRNSELEKLVADAEQSLANQTAKISEMESKLKEAEERLKRQREKNEGLAGAALSAKEGAGTQADYSKIVEQEWLSAIAKTEALQRELESSLVELAEGNHEKVRMQKEVATMHYNLAVILAGQGQIEPAIREYERVLQVRPDDADAYYNLALLYDTQIKDRQKALEYYRRYIALDPDGQDANKVRLWIKEKEFETRLDHPSFLPREEKRF